MADERAQSVIAHAAELERRDDELAVQIDVLTSLTERVGGIRARATEIGARLEALPEERAGVEQAEAEARVAESERRAELAEAERILERVDANRRSTEEERARAHRTAQDAREALADAEHRIERLAAKRSELLDLERALQAESDGLGVEAGGLAAALQGAPRVTATATRAPGSSLREIDEWGGQARAVLFVARGTLEAERERIVAEANELGSAVLGEEIGAMRVAVVRRRVEEALS